MRINDTGAELDELSIHSIVHACGITSEVRTGTLDGSFLVVVVKTHIIGIVCTTTAEVHVMVLADSRLERLLEPIGVRIIAEVIVAILTKTVTTRQRSA